MISTEALELLLKVDSAVEHHDIGLMGEARYLDAKENLQDYIASLESQLADVTAKRDALMDCFFEFETVAPNGELLASVLDMHKRLESLESQLADAQARLAEYEVGFDPKVHPAPYVDVLILDDEDDFIRVQYRPDVNHYWSALNWWCDDSPDLKRWFPLPGSKGGEA